MANRTILALWDKGNRGKSATLRLLLDELKNAGGTVKSREDLGYPDVRCVLRYLGKTVGLTTRGDTRGVLEEDFAFLGECDLYICATRSKDGSCDFVKEQAQNGTLIWCGKETLTDETGTFAFPPHLYDLLNRSQAANLLHIVQELLSGMTKGGASTCASEKDC